MIAFTCSHCGMKFRVREKFAGRSSRCPTCKQLLTVPVTDRTEESVPADSIDGPLSSVAQAGITGGATLAPGSAPPGQKPVPDLLAGRAGNAERYVIAGEIARGGMGAVLRAVDCDIRREVAVKFMLDNRDPQKKARFVEEAQITGQLEHPNIVPIHELGVDAQKRLFFSMKLVRGKSLAQVLDGLRQNPKTGEKEWPLSRLLTVFVNVCHALAYAHSRGVVHRDLKPANVMVGDFGAVYVMDWGLAKVRGQESRVRSQGSGVRGQESKGAALVTPDSCPLTPARVVTSREPDTDLTQEGAVLGTPLYMPPEQATGCVQDVDERSDVYSLGAILYELLTLQPPIEAKGGFPAIVLRVVEGRIIPPEQRAPQRVRAGQVPKELSAVALKALAKDPNDRYPTVEALRRDIERYQEGRSVSARQDTAREILWKLVKRNQGASLTTAAALLIIAVIVGFSIKLINDGRLRAEDAYAAYRQEQEAKRTQAKESVPVILEAARFAVEQRRFAEALVQANVAVDYDPDHAGAQLLRAKLLIGERDFPAARAALERFLELQPGDAAGTRLLDLCRKAQAEDSRSVAAFADAFLSLNEVVLAARMVATREELLALYRKRIDSVWPIAGSKHLMMDKDGNCTFDLRKRRDATDLEPLRGIPLTRLVVSECAKLRDLAALRGMPLTALHIHTSPNVTDLTALRGLPLTELILDENGPIQDLSPLKDMKLTSLILICTRVFPGKSLAPKELAVLRGMPLTRLRLVYIGIHDHDLSFLSELPQLTHLTLQGGQVKVRDLSPLVNLPLVQLNLDECKQVSDLTPLSKIPTLTKLVVARTGVKKLSPLAGLKLEEIVLNEFRFPPEEMAVLRQMTSLKRINNMPAAQFWKQHNPGGVN